MLLATAVVRSTEAKVALAAVLKHANIITPRTRSPKAMRPESLKVTCQRALNKEPLQEPNRLP